MDFLSAVGSLVFVFFALGFCVFSHELGHFLAAKWRKLHVDAFALGFKPFWRKKINGVEYRLGYLPFGGYCEIPQVDATSSEPKAADGTILPRAKAVDRIITAAAGPIFNVISGLLIAVIVWCCGIPQDSPKMKEITVLAIDSNGPEYAAGLRVNDKIVKVNGKTFYETWMGFAKRLLFTVGEVEFEVIRGKETLIVRYQPQFNPNAPAALRDEKIAWPFFIPMLPMELHTIPGGPAEKAGLKAKDIPVRINGEPVRNYPSFQSAIDFSDGKPIQLEVRRGEEILSFTVTPVPVSGLGPEYTRYMSGIQMKMTPENQVMIESLIAGFPAEQAGVLANDILQKVNGKAVNTLADASNAISESKEQLVTLTVLRAEKVLEYTVVPRKVVPHEIGVTIYILDHPTPWQQFFDTIDMSYKSLRGIIVAVGNSLGLTEQQSSIRPSHMSGPLGMGTVLFNTVHQGSLVAGIYFMVIISFALAIFNLLPFPVLDGGHICFGLVELIFKRPLPDCVIKWLSNIFVVLLIALMLYVTFFDGKRLIRQHFNSSEPAAKEAE